MPEATRPERATQNRVVALFTDPARLDYVHLGDLSEARDNRCVRSADLELNLERRGYSAAHVTRALEQLARAIDSTGITLYQANLRTWQLLRYGAKVKVSEARPHETVHFIDWDHPEKNDFALAEEVTLKGGYVRRPDIVLYINGLAVAVLELKRSSVEVGEGSGS